MTVTRIYLDNAATSWPKPESVYTAVDLYQRRCGAAAGRGAYRAALDAERSVDATRRRVVQLLGAENPERVLFTANGTDSLNLALHGLVRPGDHVVTSVIEHNSTLRPLRYLEDERGVEVTRVGCDAHGILDLEALRLALRRPTRLVALVHASNVTGAIQPISAAAALVREQNAILLVDAAQSLGHLDLAWQALDADLIAAPGHKGLLGPLGTGLLWVHPRLAGQLQPIRQGGTGTESERDRQPEPWPDRYESGNLNVPGLVGLDAGLQFLSERSLAVIRDHEVALAQRLLDGFSASPRVRVVGPPAATARVGVVSFQVTGYDPREVAAILDASFEIQVRAGLQCAPLLHRALGTAESGGVVRASFGPFTTHEQIDRLLAAVGELVST